MSQLLTYYAHPISTYNTPVEERDLALLRGLGLTVLNPNRGEHEAGYKKKGMDYFKPLVEGCDLLVFRAMPDGSIPAGVALEVRWAQESGVPVLELPSTILRRTLTIAETRDYLMDMGHR